MTRDDARREVRRLVDSGWARTAFAEEAGLSYKTLDTFLDGKTWPHGPNRAKIERVLGKPAGWIADLAEGVAANVSGDLEEAIDRDPRLLPETRAHLRNQLELLLRIQGASPDLLARQEERRQRALTEQEALTSIHGELDEFEEAMPSERAAEPAEEASAEEGNGRSGPH